MIGMVQATEAIKRLTGVGEPLIGRLLTYDALGMRFREVKLRRDPNFPLCGTNPTIKDLSIHAQGAAAARAPGGNDHSEPRAAPRPPPAQRPAAATWLPTPRGCYCSRVDAVPHQNLPGLFPGRPCPGRRGGLEPGRIGLPGLRGADGHGPNGRGPPAAGGDP